MRRGDKGVIVGIFGVKKGEWIGKHKQKKQHPGLPSKWRQEMLE